MLDSGSRARLARRSAALMHDELLAQGSARSPRGTGGSTAAPRRWCAATASGSPRRSWDWRRTHVQQHRRGRPHLAGQRRRTAARRGCGSATRARAWTSPTASASSSAFARAPRQPAALGGRRAGACAIVRADPAPRRTRSRRVAPRAVRRRDVHRGHPAVAAGAGTGMSRSSIAAGRAAAVELPREGAARGRHSTTVCDNAAGRRHGARRGLRSHVLDDRPAGPGRLRGTARATRARREAAGPSHGARRDHRHA